MSKQQPIEIDAIVTEALGNGIFRCELDSGHEVIAHLSGKMRTRYIKTIPGDRVRLEMSPYDLNRGRISYRYKTDS